MLTAPNFSTPTSTMIDYNLVRDLKLRMTDLQCAKMIYAGQKFRILGRISTTVQCISDGSAAGNTHFKAIVVQDLYHNLDTHSIAGTKFSEKLIGPPFKLISELSSKEANESSTEPTKTKKVKKKPKSKPKRNNEIDEKVSSYADTDDNVSRTSSPAPCIQRKWIHECHYHGWDPVHAFRVTGQLKHSWYNKWTDETTYERPESFQSDASVLSYSDDDIAPHESDEYGDIYTNISTIKEAPVMTVPPDSFGPARAKMFTTAELARRKDHLRSGLSTPESLQHVPVPHGADWCDADCPWEGEDNLPPECGYHPRFGRINNCSARCPGGWCQHTRQMNRRDYMS